MPTLVDEQNAAEPADLLESPIHISRLKRIALSAAHYRAGFTGEESYAMERGTATHTLVFETGRIHAWPEGKQRRGKEYDAFVADHPRDQVLTYSEGQKALAMAEAVRRCPEAMRLLDGQRETLREWSIGKRACAGTPDVVGRDYVTELKTCATSHPDRFMWQAMKLGYHAQLAWYMDGLMLAGQAGVELGYIVAVESTAPFPVTVFQLTARAIEQGRRMYRTWWERLMVCEETNEWPPYAQGVVALDVPDDDQELDFGDAEAA